MKVDFPKHLNDSSAQLVSIPGRHVTLPRDCDSNIHQQMPASGGPIPGRSVAAAVDGGPVPPGIYCPPPSSSLGINRELFEIAVQIPHWVGLDKIVSFIVFGGFCVKISCFCEGISFVLHQISLLSEEASYAMVQSTSQIVDTQPDSLVGKPFNFSPKCV